MESAGKQPIRHDDVEMIDSRRSGEQIPVRRREAVRVDRAIRDRDDDVAIRACRNLVHHPAPKFVFVSTMFRTASLEIAKSSGEKPRLLDQLTGAPIVRRAWFQPPEHEAFKRVDVLLASPQVVIEPDHFRDKTWPDAKWRFNAPSHDGPACQTQEDLALLTGELVSRGR
jgi:hypothetical protein